MPGCQNRFASLFQGGFECSTHRYGQRRLDLLSLTRHDEFAYQDFQRLARLGILTARTGARWHRIEQQPGQYDFQSVQPILRAAQRTGVELIIDLFHFGWPDFLDVFAPGFAEAFARFVRSTVRYLRSYTDVCTGLAVVNEISFLSWAAGDVANIFPHYLGEGSRLKRILARCAILGSEIVLNELPGVRLLTPEPVIHIVGDPAIEGHEEEAEQFRLAQFEAWDLLCGRSHPELGGRPEYLDVVGLNFYDRNQWTHQGKTLERSDPRYKPFRQMLSEVWDRYRRPLVVSETGTEGADRADWFRYVCQEVFQARSCGLPVEGICLYPILNHPGWEDGRHCPNGLFDYADDNGHREVFQPLADAILLEQQTLQQHAFQSYALQQHRPHLPFPSSVELRSAAAAAPHEPVCP